MSIHAKYWIDTLCLQPHPEGGHYRENYRAPLQIQSGTHAGARAAFTSIYYLLSGHEYSAWHRVASDESWFFHHGADLEIHCLPNTDPSQPIQTIRLGAQSGPFETTIPAGTWFAANTTNPNAYSLVSCVVAPGFEFSDFELASRTQLTSAGFTQHPQWAWIEGKLARR